VNCRVFGDVLEPFETRGEDEDKGGVVVVEDEDDPNGET